MGDGCARDVFGGKLLELNRIHCEYYVSHLRLAISKQLREGVAARLKGR